MFFKSLLMLAISFSAFSAGQFGPFIDEPFELFRSPSIIEESTHIKINCIDKFRIVWSQGDSVEYLNYACDCEGLRPDDGDRINELRIFKWSGREPELYKYKYISTNTTIQQLKACIDNNTRQGYTFINPATGEPYERAQSLAYNGVTEGSVIYAITSQRWTAVKKKNEQQDLIDWLNEEYSAKCALIEEIYEINALANEYTDALNNNYDQEYINDKYNKYNEKLMNLISRRGY